MSDRFPGIDDRPTLPQLMSLECPGGTIIRIIEKTSHNWYNLGLGLGFEGHVLDAIDLQFRRPNDACRSVLQDWLLGRGKQPVTWKTLIQALEKANFPALVLELQTAFNVQPADDKTDGKDGSGPGHLTVPPMKQDTGPRIVSDAADLDLPSIAALPEGTPPPVLSQSQSNPTPVPRPMPRPPGAYAGIQWKMSDSFAVTKWELQDFHKMGFDGQGMVIAVIDSGIDSEHDAFKCDNKIHLDSKNFLGPRSDERRDITDDDGHGTYCAGIAAGLPVGDQFLGGVAPKAQLLVCRVSIEDNEPKTMIEALQYLVCLREKGKQVDVVSISLGYQLSDRLQRSQVKKAIRELVEDHNTIVVAAACNNGQQRDSIWYPAKCEQTISIGAHDRHNERARFSSVGQRLDFLAPGVEMIVPTKNEPQRASSSIAWNIDGTSLATPAVAGLVALLIQCAKEAHGPAETRISDHNVIKYVLQEMSSHTHDFELGYGALEPNRVLRTLTRDTAADVLHGHIKNSPDGCDCADCKHN